MSSFPADIKKEAGLVGESGVQYAGTRYATGMLDRLQPPCQGCRQQPQAQPHARNDQPCSITNKKGGER
ncbi:MAG: hypothetical protein ACJ8EE_02555 [Bradyrhizobium sp.]|jgi:hypothetical protein